MGGYIVILGTTNQVINKATQYVKPEKNIRFESVEIIIESAHISGVTIPNISQSAERNGLRRRDMTVNGEHNAPTKEPKINEISIIPAGFLNNSGESATTAASIPQNPPVKILKQTSQNVPTTPEFLIRDNFNIVGYSYCFIS